MPFSVTKDIKSVTDLKRRTNEIFEQLHRTGRPVVVTVNGKPDAVLIAAEVFEEKLKAFNLGVLIAEAEEETHRGMTRPAQEFLKDLKRHAKVPR